MIYEIKRNNVVIFTHEIRGSRTQSAPAVDFVDIEFDYYEAILLEKNDTIEFDGQTYYCDKQYANFQKKSNNLYNHRARFLSENYRATEIALLDPQDVSNFEIEGNLLTLLTLAVNNLNRLSSGWTYDTPPNTVTKLFQIDGVNVMEFLAKVSSEFEIPFYIESKKIYFKERDSPLKGLLTYGKGNGFLDLRKYYNSSEIVPNTLYVTGGDDIQLEDPIIDAGSVTENGVIEGFYSNENIKPTTRVQMQGVVTSEIVVTTTQINYDLNAHKIGGQSPIINFETGALAGSSFYITSSTYDTNTNVTVLYLRKRTIDGVLLPSLTVRALAGDYFNITNISQPQSVIDEALYKLGEHATAYLNNLKLNNLKLEANLDPLYDEDLKLYDKIYIVDANLEIGGNFIITEIKTDLQNLQKKDLTLQIGIRKLLIPGLNVKNDNIIDLAIQTNFDDLVKIEEEVLEVWETIGHVETGLEELTLSNELVIDDIENIKTVELPKKENWANKVFTLDIEAPTLVMYPNVVAVKVGLADTLAQANTYTTNAVNNAVGGSGVVNSVTGVNVDNTDPKNPIVAEFRPIADYNNDMLNKADIDGNLTTGGIWWQDQVLSDRFANYKQVWTALTNNTIEWGNIELDKHIFLVDDINGIKIKVGGTEGTIWNTLNLTNVSQLNNDAGYLQANDLDGFIYDVTYNSTTHTITFYQQNEPNIVVDLPIEQLIKGVQLVGNDLIFTFEDGSTVTVPLNTLLVGVVKSVNGLTPNSQGEIVLNITDIPNLSSELSNKLDIRMTGLVSNLTQPEKDAILSKLGVVNNIVQVLGLSGNTITLSNGGGSISLNIANISGLQTALDLKANVNGNNLTNIAGWRNNLDVYARTEVDNLLVNKITGTSVLFPQNFNFAIGDDGTRNFIQSFSSQRLDINPLGNSVTINGYDVWTFGNFDPNSKANTSGYYSGLSVGNADNSTLWNGQSYLGVTGGALDLFMTYDIANAKWRPSEISNVQSALGINTLNANKANVNGNNLTNIADWQSALGINTSWNLQQVTNNGNTTTLDLIASKFTANNGGLIINGTGGVNANTTKIFFNNPNASIGWAISQGVNGVTQERLSFGHWDGSTYSNLVFIDNDSNIVTNNYGSASEWNAKVSQSQLANYALTNGSNTIGGIWDISEIRSSLLHSQIGNGQIFSQNGSQIYWGNPSLALHTFEAANANGFRVYASNVGGYGIIWNSLNFNPANYALLSQIPTNNNQLANGANYTTLPIVQTWVGSQNFSTQTLTNSTSNLIVSNTVQRAALTGDVTAPQNSNATTIANSVVTNAKMANMGIGIKGRNTGTGAPLDLTVAQVQAMLGVTTVNNGSFTVQGTGALTGAGSTSANTSANTTATLDLTQAIKDDIQQGVNANTIIPSIVDGVNFTNIPSNGNYNIPIEKKKTIVNVSSGVLGAILSIDDGLYDGYELAINGCTEWLVELVGNIQDKCQNQGSVFHSSSVLYWWSSDMGMWIQAI